MTTPATAKIHRIEGKLCHTPTNLATAFPHGGTALGATKAVNFRVAYADGTIHNLAYGTGEYLHLPHHCILGALLRGWDNDAVAALFTSTSTGSSGDKVATWPGTARGTLLSSKGIKLLFTPNSSTEPGILIYRAIPLIDAAAEMRFSILHELTLPVLFMGIRDTSGRVAAIGRVGDLSL